MPEKFSPQLKNDVILRAKHCCEYCRSQDRYSPHGYTIDHILPISLGCSDDFGNLAYACFLCNRLKSKKLEAIDALSGVLAPIFNPRKHNWYDHFAWNEDATVVIGVSPTGRCTVEALKLNRAKLIEYRLGILPLGTHPPE